MLDRIDAQAVPRVRTTAPAAVGERVAARARKLLTLQRLIGNRAVGQLISRQAAPSPPAQAAPDAGPPVPPQPEPQATVTGQPSECIGPPVPAGLVPDPAPVAPTPAPTAPGASGRPVVADVTIPVTFTELVDDRKVSDLTADGDFTGIAELKRFAGALADEYLARQRAATDYGKATRGKVAVNLLDALKKQAKADAEAQAKEAGLDRKATQKLVADALKAVVKPSDADVDAALATARGDQVRAFASSWDEHVNSPQAKSLKVGTLANAWMRNRQEDLLRVTEAVNRAAGQFNMFARGALPSLDAFPENLDRDPTAGKPLSDAAGGVDGGPNARVHPATIKFCNALHSSFPYVTFQNYSRHGSWPIAGRGLSVDVYLGGRDKARGTDYGATNARQFWDRTNAAEALDAIEATAKALDYRYFVIYNDFAVEKYVNQKAVYGQAGFAANIDKGKALNYHGGGIKLHFHVDLIPPEMRAAKPASAASNPSP